MDRLLAHIIWLQVEGGGGGGITNSTEELGSIQYCNISGCTSDDFDQTFVTNGKLFAQTRG